MVDKINGVNPLNNQQPQKYDKLQSKNDCIFNKMDTTGDNIVSYGEAKAFGFSTLGEKALSKEEFSKKYKNFIDKTSSTKDSLEDFGNIFYKDSESAFIHDVTLSQKQQKELLKRMEMFDAYYSTLNEVQKDELLKIKSDMMCFNRFRDDGPIPEDYELPDGKSKDNVSSIKGFLDYKYQQIKEFFDKDYKKLKAELKEGKSDYKVSNAMLAKYLKLASVNEFDSDGKISGFRQGSVGDCWFLSSLNSYASTPEGEQNIKERIKENNDGSYTVIFNNPFNQTKKETYNVTAEELSNYRNVERNSDDNKKTFSSGDIDVRIMEIAANKMLTRYLPADEIYENCLPIEGSSYLKEAIIHKALGYLYDIEYIYIDKNKDSANYGKIINQYSDIRIGSNGKAESVDEQFTRLNYNSLIDFVNHYNIKENELTCGISKDNELQKLKSENDKKFVNDQHGYDLMKIVEDGVVVSNPHYSSFPHVIKSDSFKNGFFDMLTYLPQERLISIKDCED